MIYDAKLFFVVLALKRSWGWIIPLNPFAAVCKHWGVIFLTFS